MIWKTQQLKKEFLSILQESSIIQGIEKEFYNFYAHGSIEY